MYLIVVSTSTPPVPHFGPGVETKPRIDFGFDLLDRPIDTAIRTVWVELSKSF